MKNLLLILLSGILIISCVEEKKSDLATDAVSETDNSDEYHAVEVTEVIPGGGYVYIKGIANGDTIWLASNPAKLTVGNTYYYTQSMEMKNFASKELNRTFDKILFIERMLNDAKEPLPGETHTQALKQNTNIAVEFDAESTTIADLYKNSTELDGKEVTVQGKVTKVNNDIMDRNWVHIQDGTNDGDNFDLTITTKASVKVGDIVKFTGTVGVNKDFTMGYTYALILEDAELPDVEM